MNEENKKGKIKSEILCIWWSFRIISMRELFLYNNVGVGLKYTKSSFCNYHIFNQELLDSNRNLVQYLLQLFPNILESRLQNFQKREDGVCHVTISIQVFSLP